VQEPCTCLIHDVKELGFANWTDATSACATNIQDIRVIKARATAAGKDPGLPDPTRTIYLRHNVVLISALCGRDMWSSESRAFADVKRNDREEAKAEEGSGAHINATTPNVIREQLGRDGRRFFSSHLREICYSSAPHLDHQSVFGETLRPGVESRAAVRREADPDRTPSFMYQPNASGLYFSVHSYSIGGEVPRSTSVFMNFAGDSHTVTFGGNVGPCIDELQCRCRETQCRGSTREN